MLMFFNMLFSDDGNPSPTPAESSAVEAPEVGNTHDENGAHEKGAVDFAVHPFVFICQGRAATARTVGAVVVVVPHRVGQVLHEQRVHTQRDRTDPLFLAHDTLQGFHEYHAPD